MSHSTSALTIAAGLALSSCSMFHHAEKNPAVASQGTTAGTAPKRSMFARLSDFSFAHAEKNPAVASQSAAAGSSQKRSMFDRMSDFSFANLLPGPTVKVVPVRKKDLKDLPTGRERALAFENDRKRGFWFFGGPVDFKEPTLPEPGSEPDDSLLPPILP